MPGALRFTPLEGEKAQSIRKPAALKSTGSRPVKMNNTCNERPRGGDMMIAKESNRQTNERSAVTSSLRRSLEGQSTRTCKGKRSREPKRHTSNAKTEKRPERRTARDGSIQSLAADPTMPSRDRSLAALAALHSSYKSASLAAGKNDHSSREDGLYVSGREAPADDIGIGSLQDKLLALAGSDSTSTGAEQRRKIRSNSLDSGRDEVEKGVSVRKPKSIVQESSSRKELQKLLQDMRASQQSTWAAAMSKQKRAERKKKMAPIGSRRAVMQPGNTRGLRYKASSSSASSESPTPICKDQTTSPRTKQEEMTSKKKSSKGCSHSPRPKKEEMCKSDSSKVYFAPNDIDGAYQRLGWDTGASKQAEKKDRSYPPVTSVLKRRSRESSVGRGDSVASGDTQSITLADSSVEKNTVAAVDAIPRHISQKNKEASPPLPGSLLVSFPARSRKEVTGTEEPGSLLVSFPTTRRRMGVITDTGETAAISPTTPLFETTDTTKLLIRSSLRSKMASGRANIPERISEEKSDEESKESVKGSPMNNISLSSSARYYSSDRTLPCSNLQKQVSTASKTSGADDSLACSIPSVSSSKCISNASQSFNLDEDFSDDEEDDMLDGSNDILAISLSLADIATDSFRSRATTGIQRKPSSATTDKSSDAILHRHRISTYQHVNNNTATTTPLKSETNAPTASEQDDHRSFVVRGRGIEPGAAPTQDSTDALFIIEDPDSLRPTEGQTDANVSDRAVFNRYWDKAKPRHHASSSGKDLLQISRRHSISEDTESSDSAEAPPAPAWTKIHGVAIASPSIKVGKVEQDSTPIPDVPQRNIERASMA
mmetsp:Transcript_17137/g.49166  ORF Transcript_17137/g.49166 Transcript_17137/m.49166 type:complete len:829 (+) Transcript_17137:45-2531(+)